MTKDNDYVTFLDAAGNEISNDPRWHAEKTLKDAGVEVGNDNSAELQAEIDKRDAEIQALRDQLAAKELEDSLEDEDDDTATDYSEVKGQELVALAKQRGIELKVDGKKLTAPQVRQALAAQDAQA